MLDFLALPILAGFAVGAFMVIFMKGRRRRGMAVFATSFVATIVWGLLVAAEADKEASAMGFIDDADRRAAEEAGYDSAVDWAPVRDDVLAAQAEEKARLAAESERQRAREAEAEAQRKQKAVQEAAAQKAAEKRQGFHCLSSWDGSHRAVKSAVEDMMRDPDSFEHVKTLIAPVDENGQHELRMTYRARNGFGGMNVGIASARIDNETCNYTLLSVE